MLSVQSKKIIQGPQAGRADVVAALNAGNTVDADPDFLRTICHELRTPLNAIIGFSELIRNECRQADVGRIRANADHIHESGRHLLKMIENLLDLEAASSGHAQLSEECFHAAGLIEDVVDLVEGQARKAGLTLVAEYCSSDIRMIGDRRRLVQALINLATNAIKFTAEGGEIVISCLEGDGGSIEFRVSDTGIGMTEAEIEVAFTPFGQNNRRKRVQAGGIGIGLPLARELVSIQGGDLDVESTPGMGTTVCIRMPACRSTQPHNCIDRIPRCWFRDQV